MTARRAEIVAEIERRLRLVPGIAEVEVMPSADPMAFPAFHLFDDGHDPIEAQASATRMDFTPRVEAYFERDGGAETYAQLNAFYAAAVFAVMGDDDQLGGLVETIDEGRMTIGVAPLASASRMYFALDLPITFAARRGDPSQPA